MISTTKKLAACQGKLRHATKADALRAVRAMKRGGRVKSRTFAGNLTVYRCRHCNGWHRGADSGRRS